MNDTTWFWKIVDARGLADVSSDEFVALNELISKAERAEAAAALIAQQAATIEAVTKERDEAQAEITLTESLVADERRMRFAAEAERDRAREAFARVLAWAERRCPCHNEEPNPCPLCGASVENLEACKSAENTLPADILIALREAKPRAALSTAKERGE